MLRFESSSCGLFAACSFAALNTLAHVDYKSPYRCLNAVKTERSSQFLFAVRFQWALFCLLLFGWLKAQAGLNKAEIASLNRRGKELIEAQSQTGNRAEKNMY